MHHSRLTGITFVVLGGIAFGAFAGVLPFQEPAVPEPTEHHKRITKSAGQYEGSMSMNMGGQEWKGACTETVTAIGAFWTVSHFEMADMMGMPFSGSSTLGYDTEKEVYSGVWVDSTRPMATHMEGKWDEAKKAIVLEYDMFDAMTGGMIPMRQVHAPTENGYTTTFFHLGAPAPEEYFKITMTRKETGKAKGGR
jgi:hypothetical protein